MDTFSPQQRSKVMALVRDRDTKPEMVVRRLVFAMGYRYRLHNRKLPGCPDLAFKRLKRVIFVHGCFWHKHDCTRGSRMPKTRIDYWSSKLARNEARDAQSITRLQELGWRVMVVWECETCLRTREKLSARIVRFLSDSPSPGRR